VIIQRWAVFKNWSRTPNGYHDHIWILDHGGGGKKKPKEPDFFMYTTMVLKKNLKLTKIK
jgi:hypothetical protein